MSESLNVRGGAAVQVEQERYYGGAKALLAQNEAFLKGVTEVLLLTLHHTRRGEQARLVWTDFNPRPPARGATQSRRPHRQRRTNFNPRPREGGDEPPLHNSHAALCISIHAPARGATPGAAACDAVSAISIHAPREGGRLPSLQTLLFNINFNPRPPRGGRRHLINFRTATFIFQSTPPARGATSRTRWRTTSRPFQSTPPARGATQVVQSCLGPFDHFNPRPPRGGRRP